MNKNPLNLQIQKSCIYFDTHNFDWESPELSNNTIQKLKWTDYKCKSCGIWLFQNLNTNKYYMGRFEKKKCGEILMEDILE